MLFHNFCILYFELLLQCVSSFLHFV